MCANSIFFEQGERSSTLHASPLVQNKSEEDLIGLKRLLDETEENVEVPCQELSNLFLKEGQETLFESPSHRSRAEPKKFSLHRRRTRREMGSGMTPSLIWLTQYIIKPVLKKSKGAWASLNITELSERPRAPGRRALQSAVNLLATLEDELGVVIRSTFEKGRPRLLVASQAWLQYDREPLFFKEDRRTLRHLRSSCRATDISYPHFNEGRGAIIKEEEDPSIQMIETVLKEIKQDIKPDFQKKYQHFDAKNGQKSSDYFNKSFPVNSTNHCADPALTLYSQIRFEQQSNGFYQKTSGLERLKRKAAAIRDRLRPKYFESPTKHREKWDSQKFSFRNRHYDNCKVLWNRDAAFAFVLDALRDGHSETDIHKAYYDYGLPFAHGVATDEILDGKRFHADLAPPSLLIWKAKCFLSSDGLSPLQRIRRTKANLASQRADIELESQKASLWFNSG